jgi:hypothetical protein
MNVIPVSFVLKDNWMIRRIGTTSTRGLMTVGLSIHSITALVDSKPTRRREARGRRGTSIMREYLAFVKAVSSMDVSPALLKDLRRAIAARRGRKRPEVAVGKRDNAGPNSSHRSPYQLAGKRKANELAS